MKDLILVIFRRNNEDFIMLMTEKDTVEQLDLFFTEGGNAYTLSEQFSRLVPGDHSSKMIKMSEMSDGFMLMVKGGQDVTDELLERAIKLHQGRLHNS